MLQPVILHGQISARAGSDVVAKLVATRGAATLSRDRSSERFVTLNMAAKRKSDAGVPAEESDQLLIRPL